MGSLPKTRPQRSSARRNAARGKTAAKAEPKPSTPQTKTKPSAAKAELPRAPRQGFEAESDVDASKPVQPPGGTELAASVVELIGELAQTGLTSGGRLLKDALSRLSPS